MVKPAIKSTPLPANIALTERSRKFYDGTYKWDSEGFTDDTGVYREFDCYDPAARAPTPLPPMCLYDDGADGGAVGSGELALQKLRDDAGSFTFASDVQSRDVVLTVRRDELFRGRADREHLIGKMEDALIPSRTKNANLTLEECYRLCVVADHVQKVDKLSNRDHTPPTSLPKQSTLSQYYQQNSSPVTPIKSIKSGMFDFDSPSELSDCPSDISQWDVGKPMSVTKTITKKPIDEMFEPDDVDEPKRKPTTRGVAQKAKKGMKKSTTGAFKSLPAVEPLQVESYMIGAGEKFRRRSTRLSNAQGNK